MTWAIGTASRRAGDDHGQNARPNYEQTDAYRKANHGYTHSYGDSSAYQTQYRTGFQRGYQDGYGRSR